MLDVLSKLIPSVGTIVDDLITSDEERLEAKSKLLEVQVAMFSEAQKLALADLDARSRIIEAEAKSKHWITATWRPLTMLCMLGLVMADQFGLLVSPLPEQAWTLIQIGMGGYIVGRSVEKTGDVVAKNMATMRNQ